MLLHIKSVDSSVKKDFVNSLNEVFSILSLLYDKDTSQLTFECLFDYVLKRIGVIETSGDLEDFKSFTVDEQIY